MALNNPHLESVGVIISVRSNYEIMCVKTITAREETARKSSIMDFFGVLKDNKNLEEMEKEILEQRKKLQ